MIWCLLGRASDSILVLHRYINWITGESHRVQLGWARGFRMMHIYDWESTRSVWTSSLRRHWIRFYFSLMFACAKRVLKSNVRRCAIWWELGTNQSWTICPRAKCNLRVGPSNCHLTSTVRNKFPGSSWIEQYLQREQMIWIDWVQHVSLEPEDVPSLSQSLWGTLQTLCSALARVPKSWFTDASDRRWFFSSVWYAVGVKRDSYENK